MKTDQEDQLLRFLLKHGNGYREAIKVIDQLNLDEAVWDAERSGALERVTRLFDELGLNGE
jgi:hypothetical protein